MKPLHLLFLFLIAGSVMARQGSTSQSDTLPAKSAKQAKPTSRQAPPPMIMPGTRLDTNFNTLPAQSLAVSKAAPAWLRAKATGLPMYVVDGKSATAAQLKALRQRDVASIQVLDGGRAKQLYGKNARNGMVLITTKKGVTP
jgi:hypothetical protein